MVQGTEIPLSEDIEKVETQHEAKNQVPGHLFQIMDAEVEHLLSMHVIEPSKPEEDEVVSPIFLVEKPDGSHRLILNLKRFNESVAYEHFKMDNLSTATQMMTKDCYMASVDLRHAYYSVPVKHQFRKFLKFRWREQMFQYTCFPNGLSNCPRYFTKLLKPVYAKLRAQGFLSTSYIDDCYLQADTVEECEVNVSETVKLFESLGFTIHDDKSVLNPSKRLKYLGFWLNSEDMTVSLPEQKRQNIKAACYRLKGKKRIRIRELAQVIGMLVATFPANRWGPLYFRQLEKDKSDALKVAKGNFESLANLSDNACSELDWWIENIDESYHTVQNACHDITIQTDASSTGGWGAVCGDLKTGGRWSMNERAFHINVLELLAVEYALKSFKAKLTGRHVLVLSDNTCAIAYIKNMGGSHSHECNALAKRIWIWCKDNLIWLSATHIPGKCNTEADMQSRQFNDRTEWKLNDVVFHRLKETLLNPEIDLFASRLNFQVKPFMSWGHDPEAYAVDAFEHNWSKWLIYAFPPFSLIQRVLMQWRRDRADGMLIVPLWPTAVWFPQLLRLLVQEPVILPKGKRLLTLPHSNAAHPLQRKLRLLACVLSGNLSRHEAFMERLKASSVLHGEVQPRNNMPVILRDGDPFVLNGQVIPCVPL